MYELLDKYEQKGRNEGRESNLIENLRSLMKTMNWSIEKAMEALQVPEEQRNYYSQKIQG